MSYFGPEQNFLVFYRFVILWMVVSCYIAYAIGNILAYALSSTPFVMISLATTINLFLAHYCFLKTGITFKVLWRRLYGKRLAVLIGSYALMFVLTGSLFACSRSAFLATGSISGVVLELLILPLFLIPTILILPLYRRLIYWAS